MNGECACIVPPTKMIRSFSMFRCPLCETLQSHTSYKILGVVDVVFLSLNILKTLLLVPLLLLYICSAVVLFSFNVFFSYLPSLSSVSCFGWNLSLFVCVHCPSLHHHHHCRRRRFRRFRERCHIIYIRCAKQKAWVSYVYEIEPVTTRYCPLIFWMWYMAK